jgi:hypothetical protein
MWIQAYRGKKLTKFRGSINFLLFILILWITQSLRRVISSNIGIDGSSLRHMTLSGRQRDP